MLVTMAATIALDLTKAILVGVVLSLLFFTRQISRLDIVSTDVDWKRLQEAGQEVPGAVHGTGTHREIKVVYVSGALFFGAAYFLWSADQAISLACARLIEPLPVAAGASHLDVEEPEDLPFGVVPVAD